MKTVLTIAGSDCSGGAGIQADLKTIAAHGLYGMSVITALTAQNTTGVSGILDVPPDFTAAQLDAVFTDIFPNAVKIGMVSNSDLIRVIADRLRQYRPAFVVADPVMVSTSGHALLKPEAQETLIRELLPLATVVTPNIPEAEVLWGHPVESREKMEMAAREIGQRLGCAVLVKGGHRIHDAEDVLFHDGNICWFRAERVNNPNTHGTGCTLSSAIACGLAEELPLEDSVRQAKAYLTGALRDGLDLGKGSGPLNHAWQQRASSIL